MKRLPLALALAVFAPGALAQAPGEAEPLPRGDLFQPLLADPKQPQFFAAYLWVTSARLTGQVSSVGLGENIGLIRGRRGRWQVSVAAGVFSQFNMRTASNDLINTDFVIGVPFTWRRGPLAARVRLYHQSSHLGDEFILNTQPERVNLSFEAVEALVARDLGAFRVYAGGEYLVRHEPAALEAGLLHVGGELHHPTPLFTLGRLGRARIVAALDVKASEQRNWRAGWSGRAGLEFGRTGGRRWSAQLHAYDGPAPYGQFYDEDVQSIGIGLHFSL